MRFGLAFKWLCKRVMVYLCGFVIELVIRAIRGYIGVVDEKLVFMRV